MEHPSPDSTISRRSFLQWAIFGLGGLIGAILGGAGLGYFISPAFKKKEEGWLDIGRADNFKPGLPIKVEFVERKRDAWVTTERRSSAWILTSNGKDFIVFDPRCTHLGCPYRWDEQKKQFLCPCHTAVFDVDGKVVSGPPPRPLDRFLVKVVGGQLLILPQPVHQEKA
ncbi:MAG: ubiquinol-cytochrome c reductase iron-sulfur subunit [Elusimicrobia bacterium]|nr:ubiquinol-cytochrome c reductase iron-sulfur subunit [Elusimicrobiota bacterium]